MSNTLAHSKTYELKKHVGAIHAANHLSLVQRKIANALLYNAYEHLLTQDEHHIHISTLCSLIGYDSHDYRKIKDALVALISTVIEWNLVDKEREGEGSVWNASAILADASIDGPNCSYSYSKKMRELMYRPELYGRLNMQVQARFKSNYGLALYENCIRYQNISQTPWFDMQVFRKLMGVEEGKYIIFRDFKRRVLDKAIQEVNEHASIFITAHYKKSGRQILALQFSIQRSSNCIEEQESHQLPAQSLATRLREQFGFSIAQAEQTIKKHGENYILEKIAIVESSTTFQSGKILNLAKYLLNALNQDYQLPKSSLTVMRQSQLAREEKAKLQTEQEEQTRLYRKHQDTEIMKLHANLPEKQKGHLEREFGKYIQNTIYLSLFEKHGLSNVLVADRFCDFVRKQRGDLLDQIVSFQEFSCITLE